jgi:hypothetical protein
MKVGNLEVPDYKLLILGFPKMSQQEVDAFAETIKEAIDKKKVFVTANGYTFRKIVETDKVIIVNGELK